MSKPDFDKDLREMIVYLAQTDDPETINGYLQTFKAIEKSRLNWIYKRLEHLQNENLKLEIELLVYKFMPWYKRLFYPLLSKK